MTLLFAFLLWPGFLFAEQPVIPHYCDRETAPKRSAELRGLFDSDQGDRDPLEGRRPLKETLADTIKKVDGNDFERRRRVAEIFAEGCIKTADDYYHAAMIFQHGNAPDHFLQAHIWASKSRDLGRPEAKWLAAASLDRYLMNLGIRQAYGTQAQARSMGSGADSCFCLWPVDEIISDAMRIQQGAKTLRAQMEWVKGLNSSKKRSCPSDFCQTEAKKIDRKALPGIMWPSADSVELRNNEPIKR